MLSFDGEVFEFVDAEAAAEGTEIIDTILLEEGKVRVIAVNSDGFNEI